MFFRKSSEMFTKFYFFIIICILSLFIQGLVLYFLYTFYFLSSARTAPEPGHSRLIDPGHKPHKGKVVSAGHSNGRGSLTCVSQ